MAAKQEKARNARESNSLDSVVSRIHKQLDVPGSQSSHTLPFAISCPYYMKTEFMFNSGSTHLQSRERGGRPRASQASIIVLPLGLRIRCHFRKTDGFLRAVQSLSDAEM